MMRPSLRRPPPEDRVKITAELPLDLYTRLVRFTHDAGVVRNRFLADAIGAHMTRCAAVPVGGTKS